jgi:hypothetical protein
MNEPSKPHATPVAHVAITALAIAIVANLITVGTAVSQGYESSWSQWCYQAESGLHTAAMVTVAACLWFVSSRAGRPARMLLSIAALFFVLPVVFGIALDVYQSNTRSDAALARNVSIAIGFVRATATLLVCICTWRRSVVPAVLSLLAEGFFIASRFRHVVPESWYGSTAIELFFAAISTVRLVALAWQMNIIAHERRCDSDRLLRPAYDHISVALSLRVVVAIVSALFVVFALGNDSGRFWRWLLPVSVGGTWLANMYGIIGAFRLVFANTKASLRAALAALAMLWAAMVQIPQLIMMWHMLRGHGDNYFPQANYFIYAAPVMSAVGLLLLMSAARIEAKSNDRFHIADSIESSMMWFAVLTAAVLGCQYAWPQITTRGNAILTLLISAVCALASVITAMRVFARSRDSLDQSQPLPAARVVG